MPALEQAIARFRGLNPAQLSARALRDMSAEEAAALEIIKTERQIPLWKCAATIKEKPNA